MELDWSLFWYFCLYTPPVKNCPPYIEDSLAVQSSPLTLCLAELLEFMSDSFFYVNLSVIPLLGVLFKNALVLLVSKTQNGHTKDRLYLNPRLGVKWEGQSRGAGDFNVFSHTHESWGEEPRENKEKSFKNQHFLKTSSTTPLSGYCAKY